MISKICNENGLIEIRHLEGQSGHFPKATKDDIDLDISGLAYDSTEVMNKWLEILQDQIRVFYPVKKGSWNLRPVEVEGTAEYVIVPHSIGDGSGPYLMPILAVRTFNGAIYCDLLSHIS